MKLVITPKDPGPDMVHTQVPGQLHDEVGGRMEMKGREDSQGWPRSSKDDEVCNQDFRQVSDVRGKTHKSGSAREEMKGIWPEKMSQSLERLWNIERIRDKIRRRREKGEEEEEEINDVEGGITVTEIETERQGEAEQSRELTTPGICRVYKNQRCRRAAGP